MRELNVAEVEQVSGGQLNINMVGEAGALIIMGGLAVATGGFALVAVGSIALAAGGAWASLAF